MKKHLINISTRPLHQDELTTNRSMKKIKLEMQQKTNLATKNSHPRDFQIKFIADGHYYLKEDGTKFRISVSTLESLFFPPFDREKSLVSKFRTPHRDDKGELVLKDGHKIVGQGGKLPPPDFGLTRRECIEKQEQTSVNGTMIHKKAEDYLELQLDQSIPIERRIALFLNKEQFTKEEFYTAKQVVEAELQWIKEGWKIYRTEWNIFDETLDLAGQADVVLERGHGESKEYMVLDWKTTRHAMSTNWGWDDKDTQRAFYPINDLFGTLQNKYFLQMSMYAVILKDKYNINVTQIRAIGIHEDKKHSEVKTSPVLESEIYKIFKVWKNYLKFENAVKKWEMNEKGVSFDGLLPIPKSPPFFTEPVTNEDLHFI
jgi:hypothetical protein